MGVDKAKAKRGARRFPEATLFFLAVLGGSIGGIAGMAAFRHKTLHKSFRLGFPAVLIAQLALSLLFMIVGNFVQVPSWIPVVLYVILLGVFAIGFIAADSMKEEVERQDTVHKARVDTMRALQSKSVFIASQCDDSETKKALNKLAESFRFSDPVSSDALNDIEASLNALIDELQSAVLEKDNAAAQTLCAKVEATLAARNRMCTLNK